MLRARRTAATGIHEGGRARRLSGVSIEYRSALGTWDTSTWDTPDVGYLWSTNYLGQPGAGLIFKIQNSSKTLPFLDKFSENWPEKEIITFFSDVKLLVYEKQK